MGAPVIRIGLSGVRVPVHAVEELKPELRPALLRSLVRHVQAQRRRETAVLRSVNIFAPPHSQKNQQWLMIESYPHMAMIRIIILFNFLY